LLLNDGWDRLTIKDVESDLILLGATGVEDLLQENVKEHITDFRDAGMRVWMLTGDQGITAKEIGISCGIISLENNRQLHSIDEDLLPDEINLKIKEIIKDA
jgi:magnesium-transporting ATPase (P-type)